MSYQRVLDYSDNSTQLSAPSGNYQIVPRNKHSHSEITNGSLGREKYLANPRAIIFTRAQKISLDTSKSDGATVAIDEGEVDGRSLGRRESIKVGLCVVGMNAGLLDARASGSCAINEVAKK